MTKEEIEKLYQELILPESKAPYHFEKKEGFTELMAYNPICGDKFRLFFKEEKGLIREAYFHGIGCALSKASTSFLIREIEGKETEQAKALCQSFLDAVQGEAKEKFTENPLKTLVELKDFGGRIDCLKLGWKALLQKLP